MKLKTIKDSFSQKSLHDLKKFYNLDFQKPLSSPPQNLEQALAAWHLAMENTSPRLEEYKASWQNYWLNCCLSSKCDHMFLILKACGIDREDNVEDLINNEVFLNKITLESKAGEAVYKKTIADWFLRRYNGTMARKILKPFSCCDKLKLFYNLWKILEPFSCWDKLKLFYHSWKILEPFSCWDKLKLFYPRMLVAIIIGLLALITGQEGWDLPHKLADRIGYFGLIGVSIGFLAISFIYLNYECYNIILDKKKSFLRALRVGLYGFGASLIFSTIICIAVGPISGTTDVMAPDTYYTLQAGLPVFKNIFFFASVALFIGIFIQVFWEKETITEPL